MRTYELPEGWSGCSVTPVPFPWAALVVIALLLIGVPALALITLH
jgi:hypothetical protein